VATDFQNGAVNSSEGTRVSVNDPVRKTSFTPRQAEIVDLVATHLQRLYREIGARNRAHAVAEWLEKRPRVLQ